MAACLFQYGITHEFTVSGNPQQNGASERLGVIIWENAESFRKLAGLPAKFWPEMIKTANYIRMRSPQARVQTTPYEAWNGERQWLAYLHLIVQMSELGSNAAGHVRQQSTSSRKSLPTPLCLDGTPTTGTAILMPGDMQQQLVSSITVQQRPPGTRQSISNAAVYIIHLPLPIPGVPSHTLPAQILAEL
jgi:hypothetical protein